MNKDQIYAHFENAGKEFSSKVTHVRGYIDWDTPGTTIMPPTYAADDKNDDKKRHHIETRVIDKNPQPIAVLDSIQSCANRLEEVLIKCKRQGLFPCPSLEFISEGMGELSSFEMPHRVFSYEVRIALTEKGGEQRFTDTEEGKAIFGRDLMKQRWELARHCSASVLFGCFNSRDDVSDGPHARKARLLRIIHNETIAGVGSETYRTKSMLHPYNFEKDVLVWHDEYDKRIRVHEKPKPEKGWLQPKKPSELGCTSVTPSIYAHGISPTWIKETMWIDFNILRRFDLGDAKKNQQYRTMIGLLGLLGHRLKSEDGTLRSGCPFIPTKEEIVTYQFLPSGEEFTISVDEAIELYHRSLEPMDWYDPNKTTYIYADEAYEDHIEKHKGRPFKKEK